MNVLGVEIRGGRAEAAPTIDNVETYTEGASYKGVRFGGIVQIESE